MIFSARVIGRAGEPRVGQDLRPEFLNHGRDQVSVGDVAVDGLLSGVVAGVAAALYLVIIGLFSGETIHSTLGRFDPQVAGNAILGIFVHLGMSAVYGGLFAVLYRPIRRRMPTSPVLNLVIGLIYGIILMLVAELVFNINAGAFCIFLNVSRNTLTVIPISFLSCPMIPCNQCPTTKYAQSSVTNDNLS